jgi:hypothetical protein
MEKVLGIILIALVLGFGSIWTFNHVNAWMGILIAFISFYTIIKLSNKTKL